MKANSLNQKIFAVIFLIIIIFGAQLRLEQFSTQIIEDDEWHAVHWAIFESLPHILTNINNDSNSYLQNIYMKLMFETIGLTETVIRFPNIATGILMLILFPWVTHNILKKDELLYFTAFLAISPFLIFFSRFARIYGAVAFFSFLAIIFYYRWYTSGNKRDIRLYVICGLAALFCIPTCGVSLIVPLIYTYLFSKSKRSLSMLLPGLFIITGAVFLGALTYFSMEGLHEWAGYTREGAEGTNRYFYLSLDAFVFFLMYGAGTSNAMQLSLFWILVTSGMYIQFRRDRFFFGYITSAAVLQFLVMVIMINDTLKSTLHPPNLTKLSIIVLPVAFLFTATALSSLCKFLLSKVRIPYLLSTAAVLLWIVSIYTSGPLPGIYYSPNNFTNHSTFQHYYVPTPWTNPRNAKMYNVSDKNIPEFYKTLKDEDGDIKIIELPELDTNIFNLYYYFQYFHKKQVKTGIYTDEEQYQEILTSKKLDLENHVNMHDLNAIKSSGAKYAIVHQNLTKLINEPEESGQVLLREFENTSQELIRHLTKFFGTPIHQDDSMVVFMLTPKHG